MILSRIGKLPVPIPSGVKVEVKGSHINVSGSKGTLSLECVSEIRIEQSDNQIIFHPNDDSKRTKALHGLMRALLANAIKGVSSGFEKALEIQGVGYRAQMKGKNLELNVGYSHPVLFKATKDIDIAIDDKKKNIIYIRGIDKQKVGEAAANIRKVRKPEPYKGKGIRYLGEEVQIKAGKAVGKSAS